MRFILHLLLATTAATSVLAYPGDPPQENPEWTEEARKAVEENKLLFRGGGSANQGAIGPSLRPGDVGEIKEDGTIHLDP
jgi:hypothetical protein